MYVCTSCSPLRSEKGVRCHSWGYRWLGASQAGRLWLHVSISNISVLFPVGTFEKFFMDIVPVCGQQMILGFHQGVCFFSSPFSRVSLYFGKTEAVNNNNKNNI